MSGEAEEPGETQPISARETEQPTNVSVPSQTQHGKSHHHLEFRFLDELKRRNVGRVAILYLVVCWLILEPVHVIFHMLEVPVWANRLVIILMTLGFPVALIFAWVYELTPEGIKPAAEVDPHKSIRAQTGQRLNRAIIVVLAVALSYFVVDKFWLSKWTAVEGQTAPVAAVTSEAASTVPPISEKSIAVLPFVDMSEKKDQEYFGDGMAEEILDLLAKIPSLTVIGRTSSFQFKGKNEDLRTIGTKLNAAHVLEGSVRNSGDQVRITAQLINTKTGAHDWSETYDRPIGDVLKLQDGIAAAVARELQLTVVSGDARSTLKDPEAYTLVLRGRHAFDRSDPEGDEEAVSLFQQALVRDATSADAEAWLAMTYLYQVAENSLASADGFERARRETVIALKLDPNNVLAHVVMAQIHMRYDWDWASTKRELQTAASLAPSNVDVLTGEARLSATLGRQDVALRQIKAAVAQDPLDANFLQLLSTYQAARGNLREAEAAMRRALDIRPMYAYGHFNLGLIYLERGDGDGALREMQLETIEDGKQQGLALAYYALGRKADAAAALAVLIKEQAIANALDVAQVYAFSGESDEAMHWLERAYSQKDPWLFQIKFSWLMKSLEADPRYKEFLKKMNLPE